MENLILRILRISPKTDNPDLGGGCEGGSVKASQRSVTVKLPIARDVSVLRRILSLTISIRAFNRIFIFLDSLAHLDIEECVKCPQYSLDIINRLRRRQKSNY